MLEEIIIHTNVATILLVSIVTTLGVVLVDHFGWLRGFKRSQEIYERRRKP